jgi:predicted 3-demethylubiquinone-9 3-methyltransferase (glyoxalase superfamily)
MSTISPCLWFDGNAEEAARFYVSLFPAASIDRIGHYGENMHQPAGTVMLVEFTLAGQTFQALNGGPQFPFTEAISMSVRCADQAEVDHYWNGLTAGGSPGPCGWLKDRFGVSWQIVPDALVKLQKAGDPVATGRMMTALMKMSRLDIAALERAYHEGAS